jgi:uncharacterized integral membrane protein (TIGR00698 family)
MSVFRKTGVTPHGLLLILLVGLFSQWLGTLLPVLGSVTIGIVAGVVIGNALPARIDLSRDTRFAEKRILPVAIVLLGVELQLLTLVALGPVAALVIGLSIGTALLVSVQIGRIFGYPHDLSLLMGAGNGICGSSAIAATSIAINADDEHTALSISVVNLLGTAGIFIMPLLVQLVALDQLQSGLLIGGTLQAFGQVVAAGFSVDANVGNIATVVKMGRILMLGPVVILITSVFYQADVSTRRKPVRGIRIPRFIIGFLILSVLASLGIFSDPVLNILAISGKFLLVLAMIGIGMRIQLQTLFQSGLRTLLFGTSVAIIQVIVTLLAVVLLTGLLSI